MIVKFNTEIDSEKDVLESIRLLEIISNGVDESISITRFFGCWQEEEMIYLVVKNYGDNINASEDSMIKFY